MSNIAIAGLGWLGIPLARTLQNLGHHVKGTTTSTDKQQKLKHNGIDTYTVEVGEDGIAGNITGFLKDVEVLIILIPPGLRKNTGHNHALRMLQLLKAVEKASVEKVILISSTGVYDDNQGHVDDTVAPQPQTIKAKQLVEVEQLFRNSAKIETTVIRFGGLFGGSRNPIKYLSGRSDLRNGSAPVNLIHRDDCINIILAVIYKKAYGEIFNAVHPEHPEKMAYYTKKAAEMGLKPPQYSSEAEEEIYKKVDSVKLEKLLGYIFQVDL
ncbi:MAG TPA: SDR family oxidoreductase [Leeuwenhoekiella sp.]|nr:SDR family oxidoreductase [Leeuwenhoekiella sp.]